MQALMSAAPPLLLDTLFGEYPLDQAFDEMRSADGDVRAHYHALAETLASLPPEELQRRKQSADLSFLTQGITFTVYGRDEGTERIFPYDLLPRLITAQEWDRIERGLTGRNRQRLKGRRGGQDVGIIIQGHQSLLLGPREAKK